MAGGAVAADGEVLCIRAVGRNQAAVRIVTAGTAVMGLGGDAEQGVVVAVRAACRCDLHQRAMVRRIGRMGDFPREDMAAGAVATTDRETRLQVRNGRMAMCANTLMRYGHRRIGVRARIVTDRA